ncbi:MAG: hypothetical protein ACREBV_00975 [Candidatus Zixiibacteriota bacterium]
MNSRKHRFVENPWDGNGANPAYAKTYPFDIVHHFRLATIIITVLTIFLLAIAGTIKADSKTPAAKPRDTKKEVKAELDQDAKKAAEDYAYLLEQLLYLSSDYCRYFEKLDDKASDENYRALANMCARISKEERYENVKQILNEIDDLKKELAVRERELEQLQQELERESSEIKELQANKKSLKLTASLREELESLDRQLKKDVVWQFETGKDYQDAINVYVKAIINDSVMNVVNSIVQSHMPRVHVIQSKDGREAVVVEVPDAPEMHHGHIPDVPEVTPVPPVLAIPGQFTGAAFYRELKDSFDVKSTDIGIYVTNAIGDLEVIGWSERKVNATYTVAISSDKMHSSEQFDEEVHLRIYPKQNKLYVESVVPPLADPKMRVLKSRLQLMVPAKNNLFIINSSGNVSVNGAASNLVIKGAGCNIELHQIDGSAEIVNSSGSIVIDGIKGNTVVQNRMGPVSLFDCGGDMEIDNSFGEINMTDCDGIATIRNTGAITVGNHIGDVEITNRSGPVEVTNLDGNLAAFNSFELMRVVDVKGNAKLINANAPVDAIDINGMVNINNRFAPINVSSISGPLYVENKSGDINLELSRAMTGKSTVVTTGGQVLLSLAPRSNLLLSMELLNGNLSVTGFEAHVQKGAAGVQTAKLKLGNGSSSLDLKGSNTSVVVRPVQ